MKFLYCKFLIFSMVPYSIMYVLATFEAKSPPTCQDLVTLIANSSLDFSALSFTFYFLVCTFIFCRNSSLCHLSSWFVCQWAINTCPKIQGSIHQYLQQTFDYLGHQ